LDPVKELNRSPEKTTNDRMKNADIKISNTTMTPAEK
jgi:hypothetical protein